MNFRRTKTQKRLINILAGDAVKDIDITSVSLCGKTQPFSRSIVFRINFSITLMCKGNIL